MERYDMMRDSGRPWLGQVPKHWKILRMKNVFEVVSERNHPDAEVLSLYREYGVLPKNSRDDNHNVTSEDTASYKFVRVDDLVINKMKAWQGSLGISQYEGIVSPAYYVCRFINNEVSKRYYHYLLRSRTYAQEFERLSTGMRVGQWDLGIDDFMAVPALIPPIEEQQAIASYLDDQVAKIDSTIAEAQASIEEYKQWKASIVHEAVTKGLDSDIQMRDSGIDWIGKIPESWPVRKIKHGFSIFSGATPKSDVSEYWDGDVVWVTPADYKTEDKYVSRGRRNLSDNGYSSCGTTIVPAGSIIFSKRAPVGTVAINSIPLCTNQGCLSCVPNNTAESEYFYYAMSAFTEQFELFSSGTTFKEISATTFANFEMMFPPVSDQKRISEFLAQKCSEIDSIRKEKQALINEMEVYKRSLIYEAVTGKRKVV